MVRSRHPDVFEKIIILGVLTFGLWQFICTFSVFIGLTFNQLRIVSVFYFLLLGGTTYLIARSFKVVDSRDKVYRPYFKYNTRWEIKFLFAVGILILYWLTHNFKLFWTFSVILLIWSFIDTPDHHTDDSIRPTLFKKISPWIIVMLAVAMAAVSLCIKTQDGDVAFVLNEIVSTIDNPDRALLSFDGMHGDKNIPVLSPIYLIQSYELFVALFSSLSGIEAADLFYLLFPALLAMFLVIANWVVLKKLTGEHAVIGLFVVFVLLAVWGTAGYHTYGSYTHNYMFLSKSSIAVVWTPILIFLTVEFSEAPHWDKWLLLVIGQAAAVNMSSTSVIIAPLVVGMTLLAGWRFDWPTTKTMLAGLLSTVYVLVLGLWVTSEATASGGLELITHGPVIGGTTDGLKDVLGEGPRHYLAFLGIFACAILPGMRSTIRWRSGLILVAFLFIINPWVPGLIAKHVAWNLYWRVFWAIPFPFYIGLAAASLIATFPNIRSMLCGSAVILALLTIFTLSGDVVLSMNRLRWPKYKVGPGYYYAKVMVERSIPEDLVLAPEWVSQYIPTFHHAPRLLVAREHYLIHWQSNIFPPEEIRKRQKLHNFVNGIESKNFSVQTAMKEILSRRITIILFHKDLKWKDSFSIELEKAGYKPTKVGKKCYLWQKSHDLSLSLCINPGLPLLQYT